jgi:hypothetical protein
VKRIYRVRSLRIAIDCCLHEISRKSQTPQRLAREPYGSDKQPACDKSKARQGLSCIPQGAYGVVGFSRVKDERKGVFHCRRRASAACKTNVDGFYRNSTANRLQLDRGETAMRLHKDCNTTAADLHIDCDQRGVCEVDTCRS